jgi:hypothetical protein
MSHLEEFFEIFFGTGIEARCIEWDLESTSKFSRYHHSHIITIGTLLSSFWGMLHSLDPSEKITHIIRSLDKRNILDLTDLHESFVSLIIFRFWLNIGIIPEANNIILIS